MNGKQTGDPAKLARAILTIAGQSPPPRRFIAGADAIRGVEQKIAALRRISTPTDRSQRRSTSTSSASTAGSSTVTRRLRRHQCGVVCRGGSGLEAVRSRVVNRLAASSRCIESVIDSMACSTRCSRVSSRANSSDAAERRVRDSGQAATRRRERRR